MSNEVERGAEEEGFEVDPDEVFEADPRTAEADPREADDRGTEAAGNDFEEAAQTPGALHMAASQGNASLVSSLLRKRAEVDALHGGQTALQVCEAAGGKEGVRDCMELLVAAGGIPTAQEPAPASPAGNGPVEPAPASPAGNEPAGEEANWEATIAADEGADPASNDAGHSGAQTNGFGRSSPGKSASSPALGSYADLKAKTAFAGATTDGVLKRTTYITQLSTYRSGPKITIASRGNNVFMRSSQSPAPGTYNLPPDEKNKYKKPPAFSFGGNSRFGLGESPSKKAPGPGAYNPVDPALVCDTKVGFGTAVRGRGALVAQACPGPGAYEYRSVLGQGKMFTAGGRHPTSYMRARSLPGPGAYNPNNNMAYTTTPKVGFGTSTRDDAGGRSALAMPGPGTYELQNFKATGCYAPKFSATSRRRLHDLNSYTTPGPGAYNSHATSFGY